MEDPGSSMLAFFIMVVLLGMSALFSGSETAFFGLRPYRLRELKDGGHKQAQKVTKLLEKPDRLLSTILIGNTAVNIAFTSLLTVTLLSMSSGWLSDELGNVLATIATTMLLLIFGEVTPKALAAHKTEEFAFKVVDPVQLIALILKPATILIEFLSNIILRMTGKSDGGFNEDIVTEEIIKTAVTIGEETGTVEEDEKNMIYNIFKSTDIQVSNIMVPRSEMVCIDEDDTIKNAAQIMNNEGFSRLPVLTRKSGVDFICGVLYVKDLLIFLRQKDYNLPVAKIMRAVHYCQPNRKVSSLLAEMQQISRHLSIVQDSEGEILGLVTLEDLLEVIVGDILDEYDYEEMLAVQLEGGAE